MSSPSFRTASFSHNPFLARTSSLYGCRLKVDLNLERFGDVGLTAGTLIPRSVVETEKLLFPSACRRDHRVGWRVRGDDCAEMLCFM